jgi:oxygen-independent coproporphyrinogen-3 oxidase
MIFLSLGHEPIDIASIYIGGGTPSLLDPGFIEDWIRLIETYSRFMPDYEFSVEVNPESLSDEFAFRTFEAGINRLIIGVQSFSPRLLKPLNRKQTTKDIYRAFYRAQSAGFENIAADLIFGLPGQTMKMLRTDIDRLIALNPAHISFYQLTVEAGTPLAADVESGRIKLADEDRAASMYRLGSHKLIDQKYRRYEVSNFARDGRRSRHNYAYWSGAPYIGLGPSAHGFINNCRYENIKGVEDYIETVEEGRLPVASIEELTEDQRLMETIMLSLRTSDGLDQQGLVSRFGRRGSKVIKSKMTKRYIKSGHLIDDSGFLRLTDDGFLLADKIIADLVE